jgi:ATP-dependent DNA helicase PIF1
LKSIFRQKDPIYQTILNEIRVGTLTEENIRILESRVGIQVGSQICTRLFAIKQKVECINRHNFDQLSDKEYHQHSIIKTNCKFYLDSGLPIVNDVMDQCLSMTAEDIDFEIKKMFSGLNVEEHFSMKKGAVVMLTFNLCVEDGLCNGSQGIIVDILEEISITDNTWLFTDKNSVPKISVPVVQFTNGIVRRIHPQFWQNDDYPRICVGQFPLILAWALTIHKIQGASLDRAEIDAGSSIFEYGQTYVGLSRVRSLEGLYLTNFHPQRIKAHPLVKEFYKNVRNDIPDFELLPNFEKEQEPIATANVVREIDFNIPMAHAVIVKKI